MMFGRALLGAVLMMAGATTGQALRAEESYIYAPGGVALSGYDAVSYFQAGRPIKGRPAYALMWRGAAWYFASPETLAMFEMNPEAYAPQFGGYCAYSVAEGAAGPAEPDAFVIKGGKLYMMHDRSLRDRTNGQIVVIIHDAEAKWPAVLDK